MWHEAYSFIERFLLNASSCGEAAEKFFGSSQAEKIRQNYNYFRKDDVVIFVKRVSYDVYAVDVLKPIESICEESGLNTHSGAFSSHSAKSIIKRIKVKPKHVFGGKVCTR